MSGSAGTLEVTLGAKTSPLVAGMREAEASIKRFGQTAQSVATQSSSGWDKFGRGLKPALAGAAASLAMLAGESNDTAGAIARVATAGASGFAVGGPWGAAVAAAATGLREIVKSSNDAEEATKRLNAARAEFAMAEIKRKQDFIVEQRRATDIATGAATAGDFAASDAGMALGSDAEDAVRRRQGAEQERTARAQIEADRAAERRATLGADSPIVKGMERQAEIDKIREEFATEIADQIIRQKEALWDALDAAERYAEKEKEVEESKERQKKVEADLAAAEADREQMRRRIVERAREEAEEVERTRDRIREINAEFDDRIALLGASTELERIQTKNRQDYRDAIAAGVEPARAIAELTQRTAKHLHDQAEDARKVADAQTNAMFAAEAMASEARNRADAEERSAAAASRSAQINAFGGGQGPLAQARDAKRRNRNIEKNLRTEANLRAESPLGYGTVGANQYDANGNPVGIADPFASDLGSIFNRPAKPRPDFEFAAPGLFNPEYQSAGSQPAPSLTDVFGPLGAAGDSVKAGGDATMDAAGKVTEAAADMTTGADDIATGSGEIADAVGTAAETVGRIAESVVGIGEAMTGLNERLASLESAFASASFFGG